MKIYKVKKKNLFIGCNRPMSKEEEEPSKFQAKEIEKSWNDTEFEDNIPTRWNIITDEDDIFFCFDIVAKKIETILKRQNITVYQLSKKSGVQEICIHRFLKGEGDLSIDSLVRIISALGKFDKFLNIF